MKTINLQTIGSELRMAGNLAVVALTLGLGACTQSNELEVASGEPVSHTPVDVFATVGGILSRAGVVNGSAFEEGSIIKVVDINKEATNTTYKYEGSVWTSANKLYWDNLTAVDSKYDFAGIWPDDAELNYTADGTNEILIALTNDVAPKAAVNLDFKHVLSKVTIVVKPDATFPLAEFKALTPEITLLDIKNNPTFTLIANGEDFASFVLGSTTASFKSSALTPEDVEGTAKVSYTCIIPAQGLGDITFKLDDNRTFTYDASAITLRQGHNTTIALNLKKSELATPTIGVTDWTADDADDKDGDINM